jgi:hypothetical protein
VLLARMAKNQAIRSAHSRSPGNVDRA